MVSLLAFSYFAGMKDQFCWDPTTWGKRLVCAAYGYVFLALTVFHFSLGDIGISMNLFMYEAVLPLGLLVLIFFCALVPLGTLGWIFTLTESYRERDLKIMLDGLRDLVGCMFLAVLTGLMVYGVKVYGIPLIPDVAVSISDRDQIAALMGGIVTLCFTIAHIIRAHSKKKEKGEREEMERLTGGV